MIKLLAYSDSASTCTGFGVVSKYILGALHATGNYHIDQLAINYPPRFESLNSTPWTQIPARLEDPNDPYGRGLFLRLLAEGDYDIVWILNDLYVTSGMVNDLKQILARRSNEGFKVPKVVYYYPVDCHVQEESCDLIRFADVPVAYTDYGIKETLKTLPEVEPRLKQIYHGTNTKVYHPVGLEACQELKRKYLNNNAHKFVFVGVNRNSDRKQISRTILAFNEFKKQVPDSILLLHTMPIDRNLDRVINLYTCVKDLGLTLEDVLFPKHYQPARGWPEYILNEIYNMADCFITTHLGEGFGLSIAEAMAAGTPVIAPDNTNMKELLGRNSERGYLYPCTDWIYIDNSGYRPFGTLEDILKQMHRVYRAGDKHSNVKTILARQWTERNTWEDICKQWVELFDKTLESSEEVTVEQPTEPIKGDLL